LAGEHPTWRLVIYGEGPERDALEQLAAQSGAQDKIRFPGLTKDRAGVMREASLFVLPSRFEGYPNALIEALAAGLPVIATSCPGGSEEILAGGDHGLLVPPEDVAALSKALDTFMSAPDLRASYAARARDAVANLEIGKVSRCWLDLLAELSAR
jgi:glycosyltransferase involved in cell wall biosynthesis